MSHVLWLGLSWLVASSSAAQLAPAQLNVRAAMAPEPAPKLELAIAPETNELALTPPCLGCKSALRTATQDYAPEPPIQVPAAQAAPRPLKKPQYAIGDSWKFRNGRALSVRLTPSPEECAPLVRLSF